MTKPVRIFVWIIIGIVLIILIVQYFKIKHLTKQNQIQAVELLVANDSVKEYKTKAGDAYFKIKVVAIENNALKKSLALDSVSIKKLRAENVNWRDIVSVLKLKLTTTGQFTTPVRDSLVKDTTSNNVLLNKQYFNWTNHYLTFQGTIFKKVMIGDYTYQINQTLISEKKGKSYIITGTIDDPNAKIISGNQIIITPTVHWWNKWYYYVIAGTAFGVFVLK